MGKKELAGFASAEGREITGLCRYLAEDGVTLLPEPAYSQPKNWGNPRHGYRSV